MDAALGFLKGIWTDLKAGRKTLPNGVRLDEAEQRWSRYLMDVCGMPEEQILAEYDLIRAGGPSL